MSSLIFTRGANPPQSLPDPVTPGDTTFALPGASTFFAPGDLLFVADTGMTRAEFLGSVSSADAASVSFTLPAMTERPAGAALFSPVDALRTTGRLDPSLKRRVDSGVHTQRTLGGQVVAIRTAAPRASLDLEITGLTPDEEQRLVDWLASATDHGRFPFTLVSASRRLLALQLQSQPVERIAAAGGRRSIAFSALELGAGLEGDPVA